MNLNLINICVCCFWVVFVGCQSNENRESCDCPKSANKVLTYSVVDSFSIELPDSFKENFFTVPLIQYQLNASTNKEVFFIIDIEKNVLYQYDLRAKLLHTYLNLDTIDGVISDFQVLNDSVVYVITSNKTRLWKIEHNDSTTKKVTIVFDELMEEYINTNPFMGDRLTVCTRNNIDYVNAYILAQQSKGLANKKHLYSLWNLKTKQPQLEYVEFLDVLKEKSYGYAYSPSKTDVGVVTRIAWGFEHTVRSYNNITGQEINSQCVRSNFIQEDQIAGIANKELKDDYQKMMDYLIEAPYYLSLQYDQYHHQYYRTVKHKQDLLDAKGKLNERYNGSWSIITTDSVLNIMGEFPISGKEYLPYALIPTKGGIAIAKTNEGIGSLNVLTFDLIKPNYEK